MLRSGLHFFRELLLKLFYLGRHYKLAVRLAAVVGKIFLMIIFSDKKFSRRFQRRNNGIRPVLRRIQFIDHFFGFAILLFRRIENHRPVLRSHVIALAIERGRIMDREKNVQNFTVAYPAGIKGDTDNFNVPGIAVAHLAIGGIINMTSHITRLNRRDALHAVEHRLQAPETSAAQNHSL